MKISKLIGLAGAVSLLLASVNAAAGEILVAVAANFAKPAAALAALFKQDTGNQVQFAAGATGTLYAQIKNGAPFDVLLSADDETPTRLEKEAEGVPGSRFTYAIGKLALWSAQPNLVDPQGQVLKSDNFKRLALANPKLAPYGRAAQQVMEKQGVWQQLQSRIVTGENITQTHVFVDSGNAELGFVALSQLRIPGRPLKGSYWLVPQQLYDPIRQDAVLLQHGKSNAVATQWLQFLRSPRALAIIRQYGYEI